MYVEKRDACAITCECNGATFSHKVLHISPIIVVHYHIHRAAVMMALGCAAGTAHASAYRERTMDARTIYVTS